MAREPGDRIDRDGRRKPTAAGVRRRDNQAIDLKDTAKATLASPRTAAGPRSPAGWQHHRQETCARTACEVVQGAACRHPDAGSAARPSAIHARAPQPQAAIPPLPDEQPGGHEWDGADAASQDGQLAALDGVAQPAVALGSAVAASGRSSSTRVSTLGAGDSKGTKAVSAFVPFLL